MTATAAIFTGVIADSRPVEAKAVPDQATFAASSCAPSRRPPGNPAPAARAAFPARHSAMDSCLWASEYGFAGESIHASPPSPLATVAAGDASRERLEAPATIPLP